MSAQRVRAELRRLYLRRSAIDQLIEAIEVYRAQSTAIVEEPEKMEPDLAVPPARAFAVRLTG